MAYKTKNLRQDECQLLFVNHDSITTRRESLRAMVSHARKTQTKQKHRHMQDSANRDARYARSLVGWQQGKCTKELERTSEHPISTLDQYRERQPVPAAPGLTSPEIRSSLGMTIHGGLRQDPFGCLPFENSKETMLAIDFYVQVYSIHKTDVIDGNLRPDTKMDICWPYVLQDEMLFVATIALSRVVLLMAMKQPYENDTIALKYLGKALLLLKQKVTHFETVVSETVTFTVARLITIAYLTSDEAAFDVHLAAFDKLCERYTSSTAPECREATEISKRIEGYRLGWQKLKAYRRGQDPLIARGMPIPERPVKYTTSAIQMRLPQTFDVTAFSPDLCNLIGLGAISKDVLDLVAGLSDVYSGLASNSAYHRSSAVDIAVTPIYSQLYEIVFGANKLSAFDSQLSYALISICIVFCSHYGADASAGCLKTPANSPGEVLDAIAEAFLYKKLAGADLSLSHASVLESMALGLGCACFLPVAGATPDLRLKGQVILFSLSQRLPQPLHADAGSVFTALAKDTGEPFWERLQAWRIFSQYAYEAMSARQRCWEDRGLFNLGVPNGDKVEYLVLRSFRGALPTIADPIDLLNPYMSKHDA